MVGTTSIENSELVSDLLHKAGLPHNVLNAKEHEREALIVAQAGKVGAITVATNMAGRGTDIVLGGNLKHQIEAIRADETLSEQQKQAQISALESGWQAEHDQVVAAGGLHIIGTERHESRRIDNQLRGRAGRQGDPVPAASIYRLKTHCCASLHSTVPPPSSTAWHPNAALPSNTVC